MTRGAWLLAAGAVLLLIGGGGVVYVNSKLRGIRNNNPGNLEKTAIAWKGKVPHAQNTDSRFEQFRDTDGIPGHVWGIRALYMDVRGDVLKDGLNTTAKLISSYAPAMKDGKVENNTAAYIAAVSRAIGKAPSDTLTAADLRGIVKAIIAHENFGFAYPEADITRAMALA